MKKFVTILTAFFLCAVMTMPVLAEGAHPSRVVDEADILTFDEESMLLNELNEISIEQEFDVVVVTVDSLEGKSARDFADDYYDYNGYGMGSDYDGALFLISMEEREWYISTCGYGITALYDDAIDEIGNEVVDELSAGYYYDAFSEFAEMCEEYVEEARAGYVSVRVVEEDGNLSFIMLPVCILIGFLLAFIPMFSMKKQMKNVAMRGEASDYVKQGSKRITRSRDAFLYHTVSRTAKPKESTTHRSSSGRSHGGGGGRF